MTDGRAFPGANAIEDPLVKFARRCADPASIVYARVFAMHPEAPELLRREKRGLVRGEMLSRAFEIIIDYVRDRRYAPAMIGAELTAHEA